jgi:hydrogenase nickel incorporation protein HypA/HybF
MGAGAVHDYHAVQALVERLTGDGSELPVQGVARVHVRAGAALSPEALRQAYEMLTPGTPLEGSELVVEARPHELACPACGRTWALGREDLAGHLAICPSCGALSPLGDGALLEVLAITRR